MGEIAEMHLDGTLCEMCGEYMGDAIGFPRYCSETCAKDRGAEYIDFDDDNNDEHEETTLLEDVHESLADAIIMLEVGVDELKDLGKSKKARALRGFIKQLEIFKESIK